eukprot:Rmarinus@m.313
MSMFEQCKNLDLTWSEVVFFSIGGLIVLKTILPRSAPKPVVVGSHTEFDYFFLRRKKNIEDFYNGYVAPVLDYLSSSLPPGPKCIPMRSVVNLQKGGTMLYTYALMRYFSNYSPAAYVYLGLHGTYGLTWLLKDQIFPDPAWERHVTVPSIMMAIVAVLGPYWYASYATISSFVEIEPWEICAAITVHTLGIVLMMGADCQKYFTLRLKRGLISDGFFKRSRNINYLGEMMIYGSYAFVSKSTTYWSILLFIWSTLFMKNMFAKESSLRKKSGWEPYRVQSGFLFPKLC